MQQLSDWAVQYIARVDPSFSDLGDAAKLSENLFTSGRLDSMALMNFLLDAEEEFGFSFTPEAFQDRRLQTITGFVEIALELRGQG